MAFMNSRHRYLEIQLKAATVVDITVKNFRIYVQKKNSRNLKKNPYESLLNTSCTVIEENHTKPGKENPREL